MNDIWNTGSTAVDIAADLWADAERSARYHAARAAFFGALKRWIMLSMVLSSIAATVALLAGLPPTASSAAALASAPAAITVFGIAIGAFDKAHSHKKLRRRFLSLAGRIDRAQTNPHTIDEMRAELHSIYAAEPPVVFHALNAACHNAVAQAIGAPKSRYQKLPRWKFYLRNVWPFRAADFPRLDQAH